MFGGVGKSAGWATILGAVGVALCGSVSAKAADLGGDCCADLEERVAELEATTARKGNRKVTLTISGWVNEAVFWWSRALLAPAGTPVDKDDTSWYIQTGIEQKWMPVGKTTVFGEFRHDNWGLTTKAIGGSIIEGSDLDFWAGGAVQHIDAAAMDFYLIYRHAGGTVTTANGAETSLDAFQEVMGGALIQF
jgi:hypothetical protein